MVASLAALFACGDDDDGIGDELDDLADGDGGAEIVGLRIEALPPSPHLVGIPVVLTAVPLDDEGNDITAGGADLAEFTSGLTWASSDPSVVDVSTLVVAESTMAVQATLVSAGSATVTATYDGIEATIKLTVTSL